MSASPGRDGHLFAADLTGLTDAVETTGLASAPPVTEVCPLAYDGQEIRYNWTAAGAAHEAASCEVAFDPADPLVVAGEALAEGIG